MTRHLAVATALLLALATVPASAGPELLPKIKKTGQVSAGWDGTQRFRGRRDANIIGGYYISHELQDANGDEYLAPLIWLDQAAALEVLVAIYTALVNNPNGMASRPTVDGPPHAAPTPARTTHGLHTG